MINFSKEGKTKAKLQYSVGQNQKVLEINQKFPNDWMNLNDFTRNVLKLN